MNDSDDAIQRQQVLRRLYTATLLCSFFIVVEVIGGLISGSLAVLSDAAHLFADLASFAVAIAASYLASLPATARHTFGLKRSESLAALFSMVSLAFVSVGLAYEAIRRLLEPPERGVDGNIMTLIAGIGVVVNVILAWVLGENHVHLPGGNDHDHDHDHGHSGHESNERSHSHSIGQQKYGHRLHDGPEMEEKYGHDHDKEDNHSHEHSHEHAHSNNTHHATGPSSSKPTTTSSSHEKTPLIVPVGSPDGVQYFDAMDKDHDNDDDHRHDNDAETTSPHLDKRNVNLRAAYLHVMADLAQSVAVFMGGIFIWWKPSWHIIDPILTLLFCVLVLYNTIGVLRSSIQVLLEEIPPSVDWQKVYAAVSQVPNVSDVHDLHIWCISHGSISLSLHCTSSDPNAIANINCTLQKFGIYHSTIQVQPIQGPCPSCTNPECCTSHLSNRLGVS